MPCPHNEITIVQRSQRQSAVAAAAYQSGEKLFCEYDQQVKHYPEKRGIVHNEILLPANAPQEYTDRNTLWNAAEAVEKQWNSQLARRWVLTIPREIPPDQYAVLVREFCEQQFVSKGMIADFAIHDPHPPGHNPHAHVLLTMRAMDEHGKWLPKSRKVYDLDENGERIKLPSGRWKSHKEDTVDWNDQKYCEIWRHEWEVIQNRYLEANDRPERVDLRSYARQGLDIIPTVHEGAAVRQMEKRGIQTNIGTEGAHQTELVGEVVARQGVRFAKQQIQEHPAKAVRKAEDKYIKATVDFQYRATVQEHPEMESNPVLRFWQKQRIKKQYAQQAREAAKAGAAAAETTAQATGKAAQAAEKATAKAAAFIKRHKGGVVLFLLCGMVLALLQSCMSSVITIGQGAVGAITASTYAAEDEDLLGAEEYYCSLEAELQDYLDTYEHTHDYDEYHYDLDEIKHDPYVLLSIVSALHEGAWTLDEVQGTLDMLFEKQYILTETVETKTKYRTETKTGERPARDPYTGEFILDEYGWQVMEEY